MTEVLAVNGLRPDEAGQGSNESNVPSESEKSKDGMGVVGEEVVAVAEDIAVMTGGYFEDGYFTRAVKMDLTGVKPALVTIHLPHV